MIGSIIGFNTADKIADLRLERIEDDIFYILKMLCNKKESDSENTKEPDPSGKV